MEVICTEVIIETIEAAEITTYRQEFNCREDPHVYGRTQKWSQWKKEKGV